MRVCDECGSMWKGLTTLWYVDDWVCPFCQGKRLDDECIEKKGMYESVYPKQYPG